jgi:hypothetical protein
MLLEALAEAEEAASRGIALLISPASVAAMLRWAVQVRRRRPSLEPATLTSIHALQGLYCACARSCLGALKYPLTLFLSTVNTTTS